MSPEERGTAQNPVHITPVQAQDGKRPHVYDLYNHVHVSGVCLKNRFGDRCAL